MQSFSLQLFWLTFCKLDPSVLHSLHTHRTELLLLDLISIVILWKKQTLHCTVLQFIVNKAVNSTEALHQGCKIPGRQVGRATKFWRLRLKFADLQRGTCFTSHSSPYNFEAPLRYWKSCVFLHNFCYIISLPFYSFCLCGAIGQNGPRPHRVEVPSSHTIRHTHTPCRIPLYERSARRSGRYLHNIQKTQRD